MPGSRVEYSDAKLVRPEYIDSSSPSRSPFTMFLKLRENRHNIRSTFYSPDSLSIGQLNDFQSRTRFERSQVVALRVLLIDVGVYITRDHAGYSAFPGIHVISKTNSQDCLTSHYAQKLLTAIRMLS